MKLTQGLAAVVLLASASIAQAEITGNASVVSDYNWRGITQTAGDPAIQGGIDYAHDSGFYAGAWGSNVDFGDCCDENVETDLYFGWSGGETLHLERRPHLLPVPGCRGPQLPRDLRVARLGVADGQDQLLERLRQLRRVGLLPRGQRRLRAAGQLRREGAPRLQRRRWHRGGLWRGQLLRLVGWRDLRARQFHARPEVRRRQRPRGPSTARRMTFRPARAWRSSRSRPRSPGRKSKRDA